MWKLNTWLSALSLKKCYHSTLKKKIHWITWQNFELLLRVIVHLAIFGIKMRRSQNFSKNSHIEEEKKKQTTQNSSSTVKNSKIPHLQQIANFHIFAPGKHLQFSQQIRLWAPIHIFLSSPPLEKKSLSLFSENQTNTWGKISDNIILILGI